MTSTTDIANLIASNTELKDYYEGIRGDLQGDRQAYADDVAAKKSELDAWRDANPMENRFVKEFVFQGSENKIYPLAWHYPGDNRHGLGRLNINRGHWEENPGPAHHYGALFLDLEGVGTGWDGGTKFSNVKYIGHTYHTVAFHHSFVFQHTAKEKIDPNGADMHSASAPPISGVWLRGGGIKYRVIANWDIGLVTPQTFADDEKTTIRTYANTRWYALPRDVPAAADIVPTGPYA